MIIYKKISLSTFTNLTEGGQNRKGRDNQTTDYQPLTNYISGMPTMLRILNDRFWEGYLYMYYENIRIINKSCLDNGANLQTNWNMCK